MSTIPGEYLNRLTEKSRDRPRCPQAVGSLSGVTHRNRRWVEAWHTSCDHHLRH